MAPPLRPSIDIDLPAEQKKQVLQVLETLTLSGEQVVQVAQVFERELHQGLSADPTERACSSLQAENTYVRALLDGTEEGDYLALDLGGTNFRVLLCRMRQGKCESLSRNYNVPAEKLTGPAAHVFDHLAESIFKFLSEEDMLDKRLPIGFTFSFPMHQTGLKKGVLVTWTKSFANPDGVGQDAVALLEAAIAKRGDIYVDVVAILNDTTGTLMAGSYLDRNCAIGVIIGTGCNAAYVEQIKNIAKWTKEDESEFDINTREVVIDLESGAFGDNGSLDFVKTPYDFTVDKHSNHVGSFTFEKLFAGHYIGDVARLVLLDLTEKGLLFKGQVSQPLRQWTSFTAAHLSNIESETSDNGEHIAKLLQDLDLEGAASTADRQVLRYVCSALSIRCAQVVCAKLSILVNHLARDAVTIAVDGSFFRCHPKLEKYFYSWFQHLCPNTKVTLIDAVDGSGRGAAFVAAVAVRLEQQSRKA